MNSSPTTTRLFSLLVLFTGPVTFVLLCFALSAAEKVPAPADPKTAGAPPTFAVRGTVLDSQWQPIEGAEARLILDGPGGGKLAGTRTTDAEGRFEIPGWVVSYSDGQGDWRLEVTAEGFAVSVLDQLFAGFGVKPVGPIFLFEPVSVSGAVVDNVGGPIADAEIRVVPGAAEWSREYYSNLAPRAVSDGRGRFVVSGLAPGRVSVGVSAKGHADRVLLLSIPTDGLRRLSVSLEPERKLTGIVVDESGEALPNAFVMSGAASFWRAPVDVGPEGRFEVRGLADDWSKEWSVHAPGYIPQRRVGFSDPEGRPIVLEKSHVIHVIVEPDDSDRELRITDIEVRSGAEVGWCGFGEQSHWREAERVGALVRINPLECLVYWQSALSDDPEELTRGKPSRVVVNLNDGSRLWIKEDDIAWQDRRGTARFRVERPGAVEGRVLEYPSKDPVKDTTVILNHWSVIEPTWETVTDARGCFRFEGIAPGEVHSVSVVNESWRSFERRVVVKSGETTRGVDVLVQRPPRVKGTITIDGEPPPHPVLVGLTDYSKSDEQSGGAFGVGVSDPQGRYSLIPHYSRPMILVPKRPSTPSDGAYRKFQEEFTMPTRAPWPWNVLPPYFGTVWADVELGGESMSE